MKIRRYYFVFIFTTLLSTFHIYAQNISFYEQWNGHVNFTMIGNTLNTGENNLQQTLQILDSSSAVLNLPTSSTILSAYLYWSGSGTGDFEVTLNNTNIVADRTFSSTLSHLGNQYHFFACMTDITTLVQTLGNTSYNFSDLDLSGFLPTHFNIRTNYGGWAIIIVYEDLTLPINQINLYDGLENLPSAINITLDNLNVLNTDNAKIGFLAWEGDSSWSSNETVRVNNNILQNLPLNPPNNVFNSTNTYTGSNQLYNMDLDEFSIENFVNVGDTSAMFQITSGQDFVLMNVVLTQLNNSLPDATIEVLDAVVNCSNNTITVDYTVFNNLSTYPLPANTPIAFFIDNQLVGTSTTQNSIPIDGAENGQIIINIPDDFDLPLILTAVVDDVGDGSGIVNEIDEDNNSFLFEVFITPVDDIIELSPLKSCDISFGNAVFDLNEMIAQIDDNDNEIKLFSTLQDALEGTNQINNIQNYQTTTPSNVYATLSNQLCQTIFVITLNSGKCKPIVYNFISDNNDGDNDEFFVEGLRDVFLNHEIFIYDRWGSLIWKGNQNTDTWQGFNNQGYLVRGNRTPKRSTYFYVIHLNDDEFIEPLVGFIYYIR